MSTNGSLGALTTPNQHVEHLRAAVDRRDWIGLRSLCHPEARLVTPLSGGVALSVDEAIDALRMEIEASNYAAFHYYVDDLDEHAAVAVGAFRLTEPSGFYESSHVCWVVTFVEGLLFRQQLFDSLEEGQRAYRELGVELGLGSLERPEQPSPTPA